MVDAKDVQMDSSSKTADAAVAKTEQKPTAAPRSLAQELHHQLASLTTAVDSLEPRYTTLVLRSLPTIRKRTQTPEGSHALKQVIEEAFPLDSPQRQNLLSAFADLNALPEPEAPASMDIDGEPITDSAEPKEATSVKEKEKKKTAKPPRSAALPEADIYLTLLTIVWLLDHKELSKGEQLASHTVQRLQALNRRTLDQLQSRVYFYFARFHELADDEHSLASIRPILLSAQRTSALRRDDDSQATILNLLLRNYFHYNLFEQADKLIANSTFPESAGNAQLARWYFYLGRIRAIQLSYTEAHGHLESAIRRAPAPAIAPGFLQTAYKFCIIVELLMGDIPERSIFRQPVLRDALVPYLQIAQAVRTGNIAQFEETLAKYKGRFRAETTYTLVLRLRHNVIKTALRSISLAYSRIPLSSVCTKLKLDSEEEAEYIVAKAIKDGVIDAQLDHEQGAMKSKDVLDIYSTNEPQRAFHERIQFLMQMHNDSVRAMRYRPGAHTKALESAEEARDRERELAKEIADGGLDSDDDMPEGF
ncbi:uncharacterized protein L969DRAFT_93660 [Mixia osmundae IAM 14324]|uniref:PCI domain-containing protein n=1 Tax=Mixia osmundae (strain CBS 9802 / IAM 14324 / JCM 22182 / KY 12970) TaxID=764103 RepID=G7E979_MIXOS|nr:uncharacterized protein L969DRAFT_93660 [Mixia osmundae IAM 14324]KEI39820.1 hypothetical protein L969DRAFT_93660 [Mixia osmundae IAM 14324]GAA99198.1 hypothetical protein E5Q_05890 [Mixia osmundae IAM 14324]